MHLNFINYIIAIVVCCSCSKKTELPGNSQMYPPYRLIKLFSKKLKAEKELRLTCYGINYCLPEGYEYKKGIGNFAISYSLSKHKNDEVSLEETRNLLIFVAENLLRKINSDAAVIPDLDIYPFTSDVIKLDIRFEDQNRIELGQGIASVYFSKGKIKYKGYNISEYRERYPAVGKHYTIHEESYEEALDIVKKEGNLTILDQNDYM